MNRESEIFTRRPPGVPQIRSVNWGGMSALYMKEVRRFFKVQLQTIWAPALTTLMYLVIFTVALGRGGAQVSGVAFADFVAPGLIMMGMMNNAFANSSFALLAGKIQGTIIDYLMPPISSLELLLGLTAAAVTRAVLVGVTIWAAMLFWPGVHVGPKHLWAIIAFGLLGAIMLALMGLLTSIWSEKFDHNAAVTNFVVAPLTLLSGTFYSIDRLSPNFAAISRANPFHYAIDGFRYGFIGQADVSYVTGAAVLTVLNLVMGIAAYLLLRSGWKLKN
jgi:ABC-2 type transport system permease protein